LTPFFFDDVIPSLEAGSKEEILGAIIRNLTALGPSLNNELQKRQDEVGRSSAHSG
jgi:hypothetical protein